MMPYVKAGLGFAETLPESGSAAGSIMAAVSDWDWHEWALAAVAAYLVVRAAASGARKGYEAAARPIQKRRKRLKRLASAKKRYERERDSILAV